MSLTTKTMLAYLKVEMLGMSGKDIRLTKEVNIDLQTSQAAGFYQKCKIDRKSLKDIIKTTESARDIHRTLTRPFGDDGWRLLPATRVKEYTTEMRAAKQEFENAVHDLESRWATVVAEQHARLRSSKTAMFVPSDYPFVIDDMVGGFTVLAGVSLTEHYKFAFKLKPTPNEGHIVLDLEKETIAELKENLKLTEEDNMKKSKLDLWKRLLKPVQNMADICLNDKKVFKTLIKNIEKELDILRDLNVTNDIDMNLVIDDIAKQLTGYTPGQLKLDKKLKKNLGKKAKVLSDTMDKYLTGAPKTT